MRHVALMLLVVGCGGDDEYVNHVATYDLTGSVFSIDALIDFEITVQTPYDDDLNMGPGTVVLRFEDLDGVPDPDGSAEIVEYHMTQNMVTGAAVATVTTDLQNDAVADGCNVAAGTLASGTLTWTSPEIDDYCQEGTISCTGALCGSSGSPPEDTPREIDECGTLPLNEFVFDGDLSGFTMAAVVVSSDGDATSTLELTGTRTSLVEESGDCL